MVRLVKRACDCRTCRAAINAEFSAIVAVNFTAADLAAIFRSAATEHGRDRVSAFLFEGMDDGN